MGSRMEQQANLSAGELEMEFWTVVSNNMQLMLTL